MKNRKLIPVILMLLMLMQVFMISGCGKTEENTPAASENPVVEEKNRRGYGRPDGCVADRD